jgi:hypothetical protein
MSRGLEVTLFRVLRLLCLLRGTGRYPRRVLRGAAYSADVSASLPPTARGRALPRTLRTASRPPA